MSVLRSLFLFAFLCSAQVAFTQQNSATIDAKEQKQVIDSVSLLLADNYVFPDVAKKMNELIQDNYKKGIYASITSAPAFAKKLTEDLQSVSKDKHLNVNFNPNQVQQMKASALKGPEDVPESSLENMRMNNYGFKEVKLLPGNIGYLDLRGFSHTRFAGETASAAMNFLSNASALIIDLRKNTGGSPSMIQLITSYLYGPEPVHLNNFYFRPADLNTQTWTLPYVTGKRRPDIDVYVLTSNKTFSAAEEFTYNLKNLKRATIIGETTGGGAHPGGPRIATERFIVWIPNGRAINPITNTNWEGTGVKPDIEVKADDALQVAQAKALEALVAKSKGNAKQLYEWELASAKAAKEKLNIPEETLRSYTGTYGEKKIVFENGDLYFHPFPDMKVKLKPLSQNLFALNDISNVRLKILVENNVVTGITELFQNGSSETFLKKSKGF